MQRQLMLRDEYNREYRMLDDLRTDVNHLESSIQLRQIHIRDELMALEAAVAGEQAGQNTHEAAIVGLEDSCSRLEDKLEQLTRVRDNKRKGTSMSLKVKSILWHLIAITPTLTSLISDCYPFLSAYQTSFDPTWQA